MLRLHCLEGDHKAAKIITLLNLLKSGYMLNYHNPDEFITDKELLNISPRGKLPAIECEIGSLFETNSILRYIAKKFANDDLIGFIPKEEAMVDQWLEYISFELDPLVQILYYPLLGYLETSKEQGKIIEKLKEELTYFESNINENGFLVGCSPTIADISLVCTLSTPFNPMFEAFISPYSPRLSSYVKILSKRLSLSSLPISFRSFKSSPIFLSPSLPLESDSLSKRVEILEEQLEELKKNADYMTKEISITNHMNDESKDEEETPAFKVTK